MGTIKNITLAFNCTEKVSDKLYCDKCSHTLADFSQENDKELADQVINSIRPVCGVFKKSQLSEQFLKYAAATVIATSSVAAHTFGQEASVAGPVTLLKECNAAEPAKEHYFQGLVITSQAEPRGGFDKFYEDLSKEMKFPNGPKKDGRVWVKFL